MTKVRRLEATVSLFIPLFAVNDEIGLVSVKYLPPQNHNDCRDRFHSGNHSLESLLFSCTFLCCPTECLQALLLISLVVCALLFF